MIGSFVAIIKAIEPASRWEAGAVLIAAAAFLWVAKDLLLGILTIWSKREVESTVERVGEEVKKNTESQVIRANGLLHDIVQQSIFPTWAKEVSGRMAYINPAYTARFGITEAQYIGFTDYDVWDKKTADQYIRNDEQVFRSGRPILTIEDCPVNPRDPDSERVPVGIYKYPRFEHIGGIRSHRVTHVIGKAFDLNLTRGEAARTVGVHAFEDEAWERLQGMIVEGTAKRDADRDAARDLRRDGPRDKERDEARDKILNPRRRTKQDGDTP